MSGSEDASYEEVELSEFKYLEERETYIHPCPCGDYFEISREEIENGEEVARCPSCSLIVKVIF
jgi:diphthamide biosynthesis protein 3